MQQITPFLWFDHQAEEAARFYVSIFKNSKILGITRYGDAGPGPKGSAMTVKFELGGHEGQCGWLKDRFGLSWQVNPRILGEMLGDPDPAKSKRVMEAMLTMKKIDIGRLKQAYDQR